MSLCSHPGLRGQVRRLWWVYLASGWPGWLKRLKRAQNRPNRAVLTLIQGQNSLKTPYFDPFLGSFWTPFGPYMAKTPSKRQIASQWVIWRGLKKGSKRVILGSFCRRSVTSAIGSRGFKGVMHLGGLFNRRIGQNSPHF